jgi:hypothetical protein
MSLSYTKLNSVFSNEASEILDYLEEDQKLPYKTFCVEDIFNSDDEDEKQEDHNSSMLKKKINNMDKRRTETILPRFFIDQEKITVSHPSTEKENLKTYTTYLIKFGV